MAEVNLLQALELIFYLIFFGSIGSFLCWYANSDRFEKRINKFCTRWLDPIWSVLVNRHEFTENRRKENKRTKKMKQKKGYLQGSKEVF